MQLEADLLLLRVIFLAYALEQAPQSQCPLIIARSDNDEAISQSSVREDAFSAGIRGHIKCYNFSFVILLFAFLIFICPCFPAIW